VRAKSIRSGITWIFRIGPEGSELEAVARLFLFRAAGGCVLDGVEPGAVGVILGIRAVGNDKDLHILEQAAACPEGIPLVAVDLIERLADGYAAALQLDVHQRQTVDKNGHVVAVVVPGAFFGADRVLIDDLQEVRVDVPLVDQRDVLGGAVVSLQDLHVVLLNAAGLFRDALVLIRQGILEEAFPFRIGEAVSVQLFQLRAQIGDEVGLRVDGQVFIALLAEQADEFLFQCSLALVALGTRLDRLVFRDDGVLRSFGDNIEIRQRPRPLS
jgi:hypothetical protein